MAIVGGRNIGDVYFDRHPEHNFRDLDRLVAGHAARGVSKNFDLYWNSRWAMPVRAYSWEGTSQHRLAELRLDLREFLEKREHNPLHAAHKRLDPEKALAGAMSRMRSAPVLVIADTPEKIGGEGEPRVATKLGTLAAASQSEILIETAYFVPSNRTFARVEERLGHGVRVRALTNSLASNDVIAAHSGYARHRKNMLRSGVEIREFASRGAAAPPDSPESRLHTKAVVFDRKRVFVGTFNLDPRSSELNTEIGLLVDCPELAEEVCAFIEEGMEPARSWRLDQFATSSKTGNSADDADPDNDGQTNIQEFVAGTDPTDTDDFYNVTSVVTPGTAFTASVDGRADRTYVLQRSSNLTSWSTVVVAGPLPGDAPVTLTDPSPPAGNAFYRVEVSYP